MTSTPIAQTLPSPPRLPTRARIGWWDFISLSAAHLAASFPLKCLSLSGFYRLGRLLGTVEWLFKPKRRRRFAAALERVLGHRPETAERRRHTREYFMRTRCDRLFYLIFDRIRRDKALALLSIANQDELDAALARGNGVYLAMSHHGAYHALSMPLALKGYRLVGVRDRNESSLRRYIQDRFERRYPDFRQMRVLYTDSYPREIFRCYKEGYVVGSAMDVAQVRDPRKRTETVAVFGEEREFLSGPMRVAIRCGAPVLQGFVEPEGGFRYRLDIVEMLVDPEKVEDEDATISRAMKVYAANVEKYLRAAPSLVSRI